MQPTLATCKTHDGVELCIQDWHAAKGSGQGVVILHGLGEHGLRHANTAQAFIDAGWTVRTFDQRGHGKSGGKRGDVPYAAALLDDAQSVIEDFAQQIGHAPLLLGHSMGGLFAARYACERRSPLRGLILSSPALAIFMAPWEKLLLRIVSKLAPGWGAPNNLSIPHLSHDPAVVNAYRNDPLVHGVITARLVQSMLEAIRFCRHEAQHLTLPVLLQIAGDDHLVDARGAIDFFDMLPNGIGRLHRYDGYYHEIFNETPERRQRVAADLQAWLALRSTAGDQQLAAAHHAS